MPQWSSNGKKDDKRSSSGVIPYAELGYWQPDYEPEKSEILACFRVVPQPGLSSRVGHHIDFPDYDVDELIDIAHLMLREQHYRIAEDGEKAFREYLEKRKEQPRFATPAVCAMPSTGPGCATPFASTTRPRRSRSSPRLIL